MNSKLLLVLLVSVAACGAIVLAQSADTKPGQIMFLPGVQSATVEAPTDELRIALITHQAKPFDNSIDPGMGIGFDAHGHTVDNKTETIVDGWSLQRRWIVGNTTEWRAIPFVQFDQKDINDTTWKIETYEPNSEKGIVHDGILSKFFILGT